jgi:recombination protein RecT
MPSEIVEKRKNRIENTQQRPRPGAEPMWKKPIRKLAAKYWRRKAWPAIDHVNTEGEEGINFTRSRAHTEALTQQAKKRD